MILIQPYHGVPVAEHAVEIVERKGTGHPDFICDSIMDAISVALSRTYLQEFGSVLHHNIDKSLLAAGMVGRNFGGGRVIRPMELIIGDRATFRAGDREIPVADIAREAAKLWFRQNLRFVDPEHHVRYDVVLAPGSEELTDIFLRSGPIRQANDTSAAVGYYPLSQTEQVVLDLERHLNSKAFKERFPETGEDVKVMGLRQRNDLDLTVAMPLLARFVKSERDYFERMEAVQSGVEEYLQTMSGFDRISLNLNTLDEAGRGLAGIYLSLLGTSAEDADSGQVGRGNRVNGLISLNRPMGTEAAAGKNPVSHVGKIYNVLTHRIARRIYEQCAGVREVYVLMLSRIGTPVDRPQVAIAQVVLDEGADMGNVVRGGKEVIEQELAQMEKFCLDLSLGLYPIC